MISTTFGLPLYHQVDDIHLKYADLIQPGGIIPAWRAALHGPNDIVQIHEDKLNDSRTLMPPVGVLSAIYETDKGPLRLTKIGYSRQSLHDAVKRSDEIQPVVKEFMEWEANQPVLLRSISSDLLLQQPNSDIPGVFVIPCHLERSVGVSPYIHIAIELQKLLCLTRHQCTGLLYNCITNESPYYFFMVYKDILDNYNKDRQERLTALSPVEFGLWYHNQIWRQIRKKKK